MNWLSAHAAGIAKLAAGAIAVGWFVLNATVDGWEKTPKFILILKTVVRALRRTAALSGRGAQAAWQWLMRAMGLQTADFEPEPSPPAGSPPIARRRPRWAVGYNAAATDLVRLIGAMAAVTGIGTAFSRPPYKHYI